jgi:hypothetical protein
MSAATSINEDEDGGVLGGFDDILKLPVSRDRCFQLGRNCRHRFEEAQQQTALHRVIDILRQRPARGQGRRRIHSWSSRFSVSAVAPTS